MISNVCTTIYTFRERSVKKVSLTFFLMPKILKKQFTSLLVHPQLDLVNVIVRPFLFTISNNSLYQM